MQTLTLTIEGMHCDACVRRVTNALQNATGVALDNVQMGSATMSFDPARTSPETISAALGHIGFQASPRP